MKRSQFFATESYQALLRQEIQSRPRNGRGELMKLAKYIEIHSSTLSQILAGQKQLTLEQAVVTADYLGFDLLQSRYFVLLVQIERAGTPRLRAFLNVELASIVAKDEDLSEVIDQDRPLTNEEKAIFYSNWYYTAIWAQTSIEGFGNRQALKEYFGLTQNRVNEVIRFLVKSGLCIERNGVIWPGHKYSHLESTSPLLPRHHANWRLKAMEKHPSLSSREISYTSPMTISSKDAQSVRGLIVELIESVNKIRDPSPCEELVCLNIDWFKI